MKKLLVIAVAAALTAPAAMADTTLYGKLHATYGQIKDNAGNKVTGVESHSSRIGIKGATALDNGMEATYGVEYGIDLDGDNGGDPTSPLVGGASTTGSPFTARNQFVGLKGKFGEVRAGRHDTPAKLATAGQDVFADTYADMANIINVDAHRVNNAVAYINKFGPVGFAAAHSTGPTAGDNQVNANSAMVNYGNGPWYAALGYTKVNQNGLVSDANTVFGKHWNAGLGWKAEAGHQVNVVYENVRSTDGTAGKQTNALINGVAKVGNVGLKAQYGQSRNRDFADGLNGKEKLASVAAEYNFGKKTAAYLLYSENKNPLRVEASNYKTKTAAVGLVTEF